MTRSVLADSTADNEEALGDAAARLLPVLEPPPRHAFVHLTVCAAAAAASAGMGYLRLCRNISCGTGIPENDETAVSGNTVNKTSSKIVVADPISSTNIVPLLLAGSFTITIIVLSFLLCWGEGSI